MRNPRNDYFGRLTLSPPFKGGDSGVGERQAGSMPDWRLRCLASLEPTPGPSLAGRGA
jgi:hypothetical protein